MFSRGAKNTNVTLLQEPKSLVSIAISMRFVMKYSAIIAIYRNFYEEKLGQLFQANGINIKKVPKKVVKTLLDQLQSCLVDIPYQDVTQMFNTYVTNAGGVFSPKQKEEVMIRLTEAKAQYCFDAVLHTKSFAEGFNMIRQHYA